MKSRLFCKKNLRISMFFQLLLILASFSYAGLFSKINWKLEKSIGKMTKAQVQKDYGFINDPILKSYIEGIGNKMVKISERNDIPYEFHIVNTSEINAFAAPGGFVFVTKGLIEFIDSDDELAAVIGHEIGHIVARDSMVSLTRFLTINLGVGMIGEKTKNKWIQVVGDVAGALMMFHYSRVDEYQADQRGARYSFEIGYNPFKMETFFQKLEKKHPTGNLSRWGVAISTHPKTPNRISAINEKYNINDVNLINKISENYIKRYCFADAIYYLKKALKVAPDNLKANQLLAESYYNLGLLKDSKSHCLKILEFDSNNAFAKSLLNNINSELREEKEYKKTDKPVIPFAFNLDSQDLTSIEKVKKTVKSVYDNFSENIEFISSLEKKIPENGSMVNFYNGILRGLNNVFGSLVAINNLCEEILKTNEKLDKTVSTMNYLLNNSISKNNYKNEDIKEFKKLEKNLQNDIENSLQFVTRSLRTTVSNYNYFMDSLFFLNDCIDSNDLIYFRNYYFDSPVNDKNAVDEVRTKVSGYIKKINRSELELNRLAFNINGSVLNEKEKQLLIKMLTLRLKLNNDDFVKAFEKKYGIGDIILLSHFKALTNKEFDKLLNELTVNEIIKEYDKEEKLIGVNLLFHLCKMDLGNIFLKEEDEIIREASGEGNKELTAMNIAFAEESIEKGDYKDALEKIDEVLSIQPNNIKALLLKGKVYRKTKDFMKSENAYKKALEIENSNPEIYFEMGILFTEWEKFHESISFYEKAIYLKSNYPQAYLNLGYSHYKLNNYKEAEKNYKKSLELDPNLYLAHTNLGTLYLTLDKKDLAIKEFEQSLSLNPIQPRIQAIIKKLKEE